MNPLIRNKSFFFYSLQTTIYGYTYMIWTRSADESINKTMKFIFSFSKD